MRARQAGNIGVHQSNSKNRAAYSLLAALAVAGCDRAATSNAQTAAASSATPSARAAPIEVLESSAEDCGEAVRSGKWDHAAAKLERATSTWKELRRRLSGSSSPETLTRVDASLGALGRDITAHASREAQVDANAIGFLVADLLAPTEPKIPPDVQRLDASFRQMQIDADFGDWVASEADARAASALWQRLVARVTDAAAKRADLPVAKTIVVDVDAALRSFTTAEQATDAKGAEAAAAKGLELVDSIETLFE